MDDRLRRLERAAATGDKEAELRLGQYNCKLEGHLDTNIKDVLHWYDPMHLCTRFKFIAEDGRQREVKLPDAALLRMRRGEGINRFLREVRAACRILACCPRCTEPLGDETYNRLLDQAGNELRKVIT